MTLVLLAQVIFWAALALLFYAYIGYPVLMFVLSRLYALPFKKAEILPRISMVIAAHNEENDIEAKLENALALDYPPHLFEIVVASDCSTDRTDEIVRRFAERHPDRAIKLYQQKQHYGKTIAQNAAVSLTTGEFLLFSDATTMYRKDVARKIVQAFADPTVGCVAGQLVYEDRKSSVVGDGCKSYWGYEKFIKEAESTVCSLIGVSGCLYAVRRSCHQKLANDMIDDFVIATEIRLQGLRTVYEPDAISTEDTNKKGKDEFRMRVRVIQQTFSALQRYPQVLSLRKQGLFAFQMLSHKVMRYLVPAFLAVIFLSNALITTVHPFYFWLFYVQLAAYGLAWLGWVCDRLGIRLGPLSLPFYFVLANTAIVIAFMKFMRGETRVVWQSVREQKLASTESA
jgi:cellulose synthase/poly-beta-1,6-N-acetylglucosamine synthase-like glycosyltransferase